MNPSPGPGLGWPENQGAEAGGGRPGLTEHLGLGWPAREHAHVPPPRIGEALAAVSRETLQSLIAPAQPVGSAGMRIDPSADSVGGAGYGSDESEVQVVTPS